MLSAAARASADDRALSPTDGESGLPGQTSGMTDKSRTRTGRTGWEYRRTVLTLCVLALFVTVFGRLALSPAVPDIVEKYGTTNALIGVLTGMWLAYALTQFPDGMLADRFGDRLLIALSTGGTGVSALVLAAAPTFWLFAAGAVCLGGVAGFHYSVGTALLTRIYDDTGTAIGIHDVGAPVGSFECRRRLRPLAPVRYRWNRVARSHWERPRSEAVTPVRNANTAREIPIENTTPDDSKSAGPCATIRRSPGSLPPC